MSYSLDRLSMYLCHYGTLTTKILVAKAKKVVDDKRYTHIHDRNKSMFTMDVSSHMHIHQFSFCFINLHFCSYRRQGKVDNRESVRYN